jgi:hypothetical protein
MSARVPRLPDATMTPSRHVVFAFLLPVLLLGWRAGLEAQAPVGAGRGTGEAFFIELGGGAAGAAIGGGIGFWIAGEADCSNEDLACSFRKAGIALAASAIGSGAGSWLAGRLGDTDPSGIGATLGALVGIPAGLGVIHLLSEDTDWVHDEAALFVSYSITQGLLAALGSRIAAAIRD